LNRKKILTVCICFWVAVLALAANFRLAGYDLMTRRPFIHADNNMPLPVTRPVSSSAKSHSTAILKQWQEWRGRPSGWTTSDKAEFFRNNCQHIIESGRARLEATQNAGSQL